MDLMIQLTPNDSFRVFISDPDDRTIDIMDCISIWGGADKKGSNYMSWEISKSSRGMVAKCMSRCDISASEFHLSPEL